MEPAPLFCPARYIPDDIQRLIMDWVQELHRADAAERFAAIYAEETHRAAMRSICYDIHCNPPTYQFDILTQRRNHLRLALMLPDCNPAAAQLRLHVPEASIIASRRRTRACQPAETAEIRIISAPGTPPSE